MGRIYSISWRKETCVVLIKCYPEFPALPIRDPVLQHLNSPALAWSIAHRASGLTMLLSRQLVLVLVCLTSLFAFADRHALEIETMLATGDRDGNTFESAYSIAGLPQHDFLLNQNYPDGIVFAKGLILSSREYSGEIVTSATG